MRLDPFLMKKAADPDAVVVSKAAPFLSADAPVQIGGPSVPHTAAAAPPGPRICETDGDQDDVAQDETYAPDGVHIPGGAQLNADEAVFRSAASKGEIPPGTISGDPVLSPTLGKDKKTKSEETYSPFDQEVAKAWSDAAREAAAEARSRGYARHGRGSTGVGSRAANATFQHPEGHSVTIDQKGDWTHEHPLNGTKIGHGADELRGALRQGATYKAEDETHRPFGEAVEKIGWTDEARAAAAAARGLKDPKDMGLKRVHPGSKVGGDANLHWNESNPHETEFAHAYAEHERAVNQGKAPKAGTPMIRRMPGGRAGFAGSGTSNFRMQQSNGESHDFEVNRHANGRGFWGTTHAISHIGPSGQSSPPGPTAPDAGARTYDQHARPGAV